MEQFFCDPVIGQCVTYPVANATPYKTLEGCRNDCSKLAVTAKLEAKPSATALAMVKEFPKKRKIDILTKYDPSIAEKTKLLSDPVEAAFVVSKKLKMDTSTKKEDKRSSLGKVFGNRDLGSVIDRYIGKPNCKELTKNCTTDSFVFKNTKTGEVKNCINYCLNENQKMGYADFMYRRYPQGRILEIKTSDGIILALSSAGTRVISKENENQKYLIMDFNIRDSKNQKIFEKLKEQFYSTKEGRELLENTKKQLKDNMDEEELWARKNLFLYDISDAFERWLEKNSTWRQLVNDKNMVILAPQKYYTIKLLAFIFGSEYISSKSRYSYTDSMRVELSIPLTE